MVSKVEDWIVETIGLGSEYSQEKLMEWQLGKAWEALEYARNNSPFYKKHLHGISKVEGLRKAWQNVPLLTPETFGEHAPDLLTMPMKEASRIVTIPTSGSRNKKQVYFTPEDLERTVDFFIPGMDDVVQDNRPVAVFMRGNEPDTIADLLKRALHQINIESEAIWPIDDIQKAGKQAERAGCFIGMPVFMLQLAEHFPDLKPKSVLLSADYVPKSIISRIKNIWNCKVFTHYGLTETGFGYAVQCNAFEGHHLRDADFMIEILDPVTNRPVLIGQKGVIVLTTLQKRTMPLIRYNTGDIGYMVDKPCGCGGKLHTLGEVSGRYTDQIDMGDENIISPDFLDELIFSVDGVLDYNAKLTEKKSLEIDVFIINNIEKTKEKLENALNLYPATVNVRKQLSALPLRKRQIES